MHQGERPWTKEEHVLHFGHIKKKVEQGEWDGVDYSASEVVTEVSGSGTSENLDVEGAEGVE